VELLTSASTFWKQSGSVYQSENPRDPNSTTGRTREALKNKLTWIFALFIFGYVGAEGLLALLFGHFNQFAKKLQSLSVAGL
jgi:fucose permease